jgi:hypothetical protein
MPAVLSGLGLMKWIRRKNLSGIVFSKFQALLDGLANLNTSTTGF